MKKVLLLILITIFFALTGCSSSNLTKISLDELKEKLNNKDSFIVYFYNEDSDLEQTLNTVLKENNIEGFKINTTRIAENEKNAFRNLIDYEEPSIIFVIEGKDPSILSHISSESATKKDILNRLKDMHFIKEQIS